MSAGVRATADSGSAGRVPIGVAIGVRGGRWRGSVTPWGAVVPADGSPRLDWWVAAADRWHTPAEEPTVRQRLVRGTPVVETAMRVSGGDVLHRAYAVGDGGGLTVVEIENDTSSPVAVVFGRPDLLTSRPPAAVPLGGVDLPPHPVVLPVGHRSSVRVALAHDGRAGGALPTGLPSADQVAAGWVRQTDGRVRLELPAGAPAVPLTTRRSELLLVGPDRGDDVGLLVGVAEVVRMGEPPAHWVGAVVAAAERLARRHRRVPTLPWTVDAALASAGEVLTRAGELTAVDDLALTRRHLAPPEPTPLDPPSGVLDLAWAQRRVLVHGVETVDVFPAPFPTAWLGQPVEAHGVPASGATVGIALRWHADRPALLWEADEPVRLTCSGLDPDWTASGPKGEALLSRPPAARS